MLQSRLIRLRHLLAQNALLQKGLFATLAILSALALKPNAPGPVAKAVPPSIESPAPAEFVSRFPLSTSLTFSEPGLPSALNSLLYLEDFGNNLYAVDSLTGSTRLAPTAAASVASYSVAEPNARPRVAASPSAPLPLLPLVVAAGPLAGATSPAVTPVRSRSRDSGAGVATAGGFAGSPKESGRPGSAAAGGSAPDVATSPSPDIPQTLPIPPELTTNAPSRDHASSASQRLSVTSSAASTGSVAAIHAITQASETTPAPALFAFTLDDALGLPLPTTSFPPDDPAQPELTPELVSKALADTQQTTLSLDIATPTPEPATSSLILIALLLTALRLHSTRRYNTGQKRASSVSEAQTMLRNLTLVTALLAIPAFAQKDLPEGTGKQATVRVCTGCHGAEMFAATRLGNAEWDRMIANMTTERGVAITDADYATVLKYLTTYMAAPKANLSKTPENK